MVMIRCSGGMNPDNTFKKVVFPLPVPPLTKMLYPAFTSVFKKSAASGDIVSIAISFCMVIGLSGKRLIVMMGPFNAMGLITMFTRAPLLNRASTIGDASFTTLLHPATIC